MNSSDKKQAESLAKNLGKVFNPDAKVIPRPVEVDEAKGYSLKPHQQARIDRALKALKAEKSEFAKSLGKNG